ncbi:MAG: hypothetical protein JWP12_1531 [Bacteroidetes bacterium]|nr:hypothetical protein [Bacteroidota bacterium]
MKTKFVFFFVLLICVSLKAQTVIIYKTYEDFQNNNGEQYDSLKNAWASHFHMALLKDGKRIAVEGKNFWGFKYGDALFRVNKGAAYRVLTYGPKLCYYEDGYAYIVSIMHKESMVSFENGMPVSFISTSLNSELITLFRTVHDYKHEEKQIEKLRTKLAGPVYDDFFKCINGSLFIDVLRACTQKFEQ